MANKMVNLRESVQEHGRSPGFYWVRRLGESGMQIARWSGINWFLTGKDEHLTDDDIASVSVEQVQPICAV